MISEIWYRGVNACPTIYPVNTVEKISGGWAVYGRKEPYRVTATLCDWIVVICQQTPRRDIGNCGVVKVVEGHYRRSDRHNGWTVENKTVTMWPFSATLHDLGLTGVSANTLKAENTARVDAQAAELAKMRQTRTAGEAAFGLMEGRHRKGIVTYSMSHDRGEVMMTISGDAIPMRFVHLGEPVPDMD